MFRKAIYDSILWIFASMLFGLLQLWISIGNNWFCNVSIDINAFFLSGVLLFFSSGIVISSSFDIWLEEKINKNNRTYVLFHILMPIIILIAIIYIYMRYGAYLYLLLSSTRARIVYIYIR